MKFLKYIVVFLFFQNLVGQQELKHQVYFETDKYDIIETELSRLLLFIKDLEGLQIEKVSIYGFCDDRGTNNYNLVLSQHRANAIKTVFTEHHFKDSLITNVDGKGEVLLNIIHENDISKIRGLNRKVEISVLPKQIENVKKVVEDIKDDITKTKEDVLTPDDLLSDDLKEGDKILLKNVLFKTGHSKLTKDAINNLDQIAKILNERKNVYFTIEGHVCCTEGTRDAVDRKTKKRNLSMARAKAVYSYLIKKGVNRFRMKYVGQKRKFPLGGDPKYDRRVEILVTRIYKGK